MEFKKEDRIKVLEGIYTGKEGKVNVLAENVPKSVGVILRGAEKVTTVCWFKPTEIEKI